MTYDERNIYNNTGIIRRALENFLPLTVDIDLIIEKLRAGIEAGDKAEKSQALSEDDRADIIKRLRQPGGMGDGMKVIVLKVDENKNAQVFKPDSMDPNECINLMIATAVWYYKQYYNINSIEKATEEVGEGLLNSIRLQTKITFSNDKGGEQHD